MKSRIRCLAFINATSATSGAKFSIVTSSRLEDMNEVSRQCEFTPKERVIIMACMHCFGARASALHLRTDARPIVDVAWLECPEMKF